MQSQKTTTEQDECVATCVNCGNLLDEFIGLAAPEDWCSNTGFNPWCRNCQEKYFEELAEHNTSHVALFLCCAAFNVPMVPRDAPDFERDSEPWISYLENLRQNGDLYDSGGDTQSFFDGITDMRNIFGEKLSDRKFDAAAAEERNRAGKPQGTEKQRRAWGTRFNFTTADYKELDQRYEKVAAPYKAAGIDANMEEALRKICKYQLLSDAAAADSDGTKSKAFDEIARRAAQDNCLRKIDEKPVEDLRIDTLVDKLEKKGLMKDGKLLDLPELQAAILKNRPRYPHTLDAADQFLLLSFNCMRENSGVQLLPELEESMKIHESFDGEFAAEAPEFEVKAKREFGLMTMDRGGREKAAPKKKK